MSKQELVLYEEENKMVLPPLPTFDEHIEGFDLAVRNFECRNEDDFKLGKALGERATRLKTDIIAAYQPIKRAIDSLKQPVLDAEKRDLAKIKALLDFVDAECVPWKQEQDRIAQEAANKRREEERQRLEAERVAKLELAKDWGTPAEVIAIEAAPAVVVRPVTTASEFTYRRGARTKPKLTYRVVNPSQVKREFCEPSKISIDSKIHNFSLYVKEPTEEQMRALADEVGGIIVEMSQV